MQKAGEGMEKNYEIRGCVEVPYEVSEGACLISNGLEIQLVPDVFEEDMQLPVNTSLRVMVESDNYRAVATMDIGIKQLVVFSEKLKNIYETLTGEAQIKEPYGKHMYIAFIGNGKGHITVKGFLQNESNKGCQQTLEFENDIDQTDLKGFYMELLHMCKKYTELF